MLTLTPARLSERSIRQPHGTTPTSLAAIVDDGVNLAVWKRQLPLHIADFATLLLSLNEPLREDADAVLGDLVPDESTPTDRAATDGMIPDALEELLSALDEREREVLQLRYGLDRGEPRTLEEVGARFELTRERIRQIEVRAMSKLRHPSNETGARDLLLV